MCLNIHLEMKAYFCHHVPDILCVVHSGVSMDVTYAHFSCAHLQHLHRLTFTKQIQDILGSNLICTPIAPLIRHLTCMQ